MADLNKLGCEVFGGSGNLSVRYYYDPEDDSSAPFINLTMTCCEGIRGNINDDPEQVIDISDLIYLVNFMFSAGSALPCIEEGNVDGSGGEPVDIADLIYLVNYMFNGGPEPVPCP